MLAAHQPSGGSSPGQGWSTARPTRTSRRISRRGVPEPVISSDSDVELMEDPRVEQRRWRLRKAVNRADGRIPIGATEVEWASEELPQDQQASGSPAESVAAATWDYRWKFEERRRSEERRLKAMKESPEWQAQLRAAEEEERQLWKNTGNPPTQRYAPEPCSPPPEVAEDWAPSPPQWLPEIPPTPRYEESPQWTPTRAPTPRFEQPPPQQQPEQLEQSPPQQQPQRVRRQQQQPDPPQQQQGDPMGHHIRTDIPAAHVSHSTRTFVAEGVRWRQQAVVWTWLEGPAEETAGTEEPRIWEESGPRGSPLDTRTRGRPEHCAPPTPSTGPTTTRTGPSTPAPTGSATVTAEPDELLERGPWV
ncbi:uncharacterized protein [Drosophila suzukii]|uniref:Uncharacterized protein n=1 Tax=Drosophila suzukii TaxID=28584 RepID=A0ABM4TZ71_DROSZ